ncbi:hypothetical protein STTU_1005 [Streptomyces sp. Tu6071]|nr:hypothetical protein STTU_1005 [Streptomyces sp. Tu6071]
MRSGTRHRLRLRSDGGVRAREGAGQTGDRGIPGGRLGTRRERLAYRSGPRSCTGCRAGEDHGGAGGAGGSADARSTKALRRPPGRRQPRTPLPGRTHSGIGSRGHRP